MHLGTTSHLLIALIVVLLAAKASAWLLRRLGQPRVIGEIAAGIALGPSLLGQVSPEAYAFLFPPSVLPALGALANLGVIIFVFLVGLESDLGSMRRSSRVTVGVSLAGALLPFAGGCGLAFALYPRFAPPSAAPLPFVLFIGIAMAVTALPILARVLHDRGLTATALGRLAINAAALVDVLAWCGVAIVVGLCQSSPSRGLLAFGGVVLVALCLFAFGPRLLRPLVRRVEREGLGPDALALFLLGLFATGLTAELVGLHALLGAYLFGAVVPHDSRAASELAAALERLAGALLLPIFFAQTGLRTQVGLLADGGAWLWLAAVVLTATGAKWLSVTAAGRWAGLSWRDANALGFLLNCRGLVEIVVLNIGADLGLLSPTLTTIFVLMALITTAATAPLLGLALGRGTPASTPAATPRHTQAAEPPR